MHIYISKRKLYTHTQVRSTSRTKEAYEFPNNKTIRQLTIIILGK